MRISEREFFVHLLIGIIIFFFWALIDFDDLQLEAQSRILLQLATALQIIWLCRLLAILIARVLHKHLIGTHH